MRKKKSPAPEWFPKLSDTAPYTTVSLSEMEIEEWLAELSTALQTREAAGEIEQNFQELRSFQSRQIKTLHSVDWSLYDGHQLIWWATADITLHRAIETFLPEAYRDWPEPVRALLYLLKLIFLGMAEAAKPRTQYPDALELARRAIHVHLAGPYAGREVRRRMDQHVGSPVGNLLLVKALYLDEADPLLPSADGSLLTAPIMDKLRKSTWRKTERRVNQIIQDKGLVVATLKAQLSSDIYETIVTRWGGVEGLDALAQSLDGKFNIAPTAVADRIIKPRRLHELFPFLEEQGNLRFPADDGVVEVEQAEVEQAEVHMSPSKSRRITLSITEEDDAYTHTPVRQAKEVLEKFLQCYPKHEEGIHLYLSEEPLEVLAEKRGGVAVQTIINRKKKALRALKRFAGEK